MRVFGKCFFCVEVLHQKKASVPYLPADDVVGRSGPKGIVGGERETESFVEAQIDTQARALLCDANRSHNVLVVPCDVHGSKEELDTVVDLVLVSGDDDAGGVQSPIDEHKG